VAMAQADAQSFQYGRYGGFIVTPPSSMHGPEDAGVRSHTHLRIVVDTEQSLAVVGSSQYNTPAMLQSAYRIPALGGANAIAIVDAYNFPTALSDFNTFSRTYSLPTESSTTATLAANKTFQVVYARGVAPSAVSAGWDLETALDIEWAHAMAPKAKIYLVEAASDSTPDLYSAVLVASRLTGVREVSMSWGGAEFPQEWMYDSLFTAPNVVYLASSGDTSDDVQYPAASPNVISCGGTSIARDVHGNFLSETGWSDTGCGSSSYEGRPFFQAAISRIVGTRRGAVDLSFDADPETGVYVYDSTPYEGDAGWWVLGGTSLAAPSLAGVLNVAAASGNGFAGGTAQEQQRIYGNLGNMNAFRDIVTGTDGRFRCATGWDYLTGVGSPVGLVGK